MFEMFLKYLQNDHVIFEEVSTIEKQFICCMLEMTQKSLSIVKFYKVYVVRSVLGRNSNEACALKQR